MQTLIIAGNVGKDAVLRRERKTVSELSAVLDYDPETGKLTWAVRSPESFSCDAMERSRVASRWNKLRAGKEAGHILPTGYRVICIEGKTYQSHRIALAMWIGSWPEGQVDHINHDRSDNSIKNLRSVSASENSRNKSLPLNNSSGSIGVHFHQPSGKWHARIWAGGERVHLGSFSKKDDAEAARAAASASVGFHPNHGKLRRSA